MKTCALTLVIAAVCCSAFAQDSVSTDMLLRDAPRYDGTTIVFEGEVVGDILSAGSSSWVNLYDGKASIGVWMPSETAARIKTAGRYGVQGDTLRVRGEFHRSCAVHGGDLDMHALDVQPLAYGRVLPDGAARTKVKQASVLFICLMLTWIYLRFKHK